MSEDLLDTVEFYLQLLDANLRVMSRAQRTAYAAAIAERLSHEYRAFCAESGWGSMAAYREILDAVWGHAQGQAIPEDRLEEYRQRCLEITPDQDEFDAWDALEACHALAMALESCGEAASAQYARDAAVAAYDRVADLDGLDPTSPAALRAVWKQPAVCSEIAHQFRLLSTVRSMPRVDRGMVDALVRMHGH